MRYDKEGKFLHLVSWLALEAPKGLGVGGLRIFSYLIEIFLLSLYGNFEVIQFMAEDFDWKIPAPMIYKPRPIWTGKKVFNPIILEQINIIRYSSWHQSLNQDLLHQEILLYVLRKEKLSSHWLAPDTIVIYVPVPFCTSENWLHCAILKVYIIVHCYCGLIISIWRNQFPLFIWYVFMSNLFQSIFMRSRYKL